MRYDNDELMHGDGCEGIPSCFTCPLVQCKYDDPRAYHELIVQARASRILVQYEQGTTVVAIAAQEGCTERTIWRAISRGKKLQEAQPDV